MKIFQSFVNVSLFFILEGELISLLPLHAADYNADPRVSYGYVKSPHDSVYDSKLSSPINSRKQTLPVMLDSIPIDRLRDQRRKTMAPGTYYQLPIAEVRNARDRNEENGIPVPLATTIGSGKKTFDFSEMSLEKIIAKHRGRSNTYENSDLTYQFIPALTPKDGKIQIRHRKRSESFSSIQRNNFPSLNCPIKRSITLDDACNPNSFNESKIREREDDTSSCSSQEGEIKSNINGSATANAKHHKRSNSGGSSNLNFQKKAEYREKSNTCLGAEGSRNRNGSYEDSVDDDSSETQDYNRERSHTIEKEQRIVPYNNSPETQQNYNDGARMNSLCETVKNNQNREKIDDTKNNDLCDDDTNSQAMVQTYAPRNANKALNNSNYFEGKRSGAQLQQNNQYITINNHYNKLDAEFKEEYKRSLQSPQSPQYDQLHQYDQPYPYTPSNQTKMLFNQSENQSYSHLNSQIEQVKRSINPSMNLSYTNRMTNEYPLTSENCLLQHSAMWVNHSASVWERKRTELKTGDLVCFAGKGCVSWGVRLGLRGYYNNPLGVSHVGVVLVAVPNDMINFIDYCAEKLLNSTKHGEKKGKYMKDCINKSFSGEGKNESNLFLIHATGKYGVHIVPLWPYVKSYKGDVFVRKLKNDKLKYDKLESQIYQDLLKEYNANFFNMNRAVHDYNIDRSDGSMFCSQLVGDLYQSVGILHKDASFLAVNVTPAELTSRNGGDLLRDCAKDEVVLKKDDSASCCGGCCNIM